MYYYLKFLRVLRQFNIPIFFEEKISNKRKQKKLWENIELLFNTYNRITRIRENDPIIFNDDIKEFNYFKENL